MTKARAKPRAAGLRGRRVLLGVTGSIAAYKAAELASALAREGAEVTAVLTPAAERFVAALTFQILTGRPALTDERLWGPEAAVAHVTLAAAAEAALVAPASANTLAKLAQGLADNALTALLLAARCPLVLAPAMNQRMYGHPAVRENLARLRRRGALIVEPETGRLACGEEGPGRLAAPERILAALRGVLG